MDNTERVRTTWAQAILHREALAQTFYTLLFQRAPQVQPLFQNDMRAQGAKLVETLNFIVDHLDDGDSLLPAARDLAMRHVAYGATPEHYDAVGSALIEALSTLLGNAFDAETKAAWSETYNALAAEMVKSAYPD